LKQITATVISNRQLLRYPGAIYFLMRLRVPKTPSEYSPRPGQFLMIKCGDDTLLRRPISIHSVIESPDNESSDLELLYALPCKTDKSLPANLVRKTEPQTATGKGTLSLSRLIKGSTLDLIGPLGNFFTIDPGSKNLLLIAGGIGIAPLKFLADSAISQGKEVTILLGARTKAGLIPGDVFPSQANVIIITEDGSAGKKATAVRIVPEYIGWADQIFACGPKAMYEALSDSLEAQNAKNPVQVSLEVRMGCGTGVCNSCSIRTRQGMKRVCKEGPVFNIRDIIWQEVRI
jgi:dihydroorotate dehydrogenase electron transfer subunit